MYFVVIERKKKKKDMIKTLGVYCEKKCAKKEKLSYNNE